MAQYSKGQSLKLSWGTYIIEDIIDNIPAGFKIVWKYAEGKCPHCNKYLTKTEICYPNQILLLTNDRHEKVFLGIVLLDNNKYKLLRLPDKEFLKEYNATDIIYNLKERISI